VGSLRWAYQVSTRLVVHSEPGKQTLVSYFGIDAGKIQVIAHGPYSLGQGILPMAESDCLEVLLFGSLRENKGAHLAIEAAQKLFREGVRIRLTIAGAVLNSREKEYWERCRELIGVCPEPIRVMEEFIPDEQLPGLFSACHCLLLPYTSFFSDSGVAYMALANGRPIIATRMGGLASLLDSSGGGFAIEEATIGGVVEALRKAVELGPAQLQLLGQTGTERVMAECGWPTVAKKTHQLYTSISPASVVLQDQVAVR
jgi:glycosyltransferase involved in cell wall biosynthesis